MTTSNVLLGEMTREQVGRIAPRGTAVLPVAAIEQHGPHMPINTDELITEYVAIEAAQKATTEQNTVCVAPILSYGISGHHRPFPGVLTLSHETMTRAMVDIGHSLFLSGFRRLFILNGHGGNQSAIGAAAAQLAEDVDVVVAATSYWTIAMPALDAVMDEHEVAWTPGHAGAFETACIRALRDDLIDEAAVPGPSIAKDAQSGRIGSIAVHRHGWIHDIDGYTDEPARGTKAIGELALETIIDAVAHAFSEFATGP